ncbi:uncharacterized protein N7498_010343 [Penicillium cinerascens]|uniref:Protein FAF1 n=1 Tax=Penicillium cinerascens TaxID=70096 RepID=A0A9W9J796_9EURO|nr:uncharacterized protein N7498_010343 [Penicillium cinerascens]KAJ5191358.1 hypothetical protein N7498_010343 [Penicillium cinerascens]
MTGKRKRDTSVVSRSKKTGDASPSPPPPADNAQDIFRKYFEAQFAPLDLPATPATGNSNSEEDEEEDEDSEGSEMDEQWDGVSEDESDEDVVEVVEHTDTRATDDRMDKKAFKAFMSAKPPSSLETKTTKSTEKSNKKDESDDEVDADNLKHDLALQRLLRESHLLDSSSDLAPTGKNRLKALDLRMQSLGAKDSLYKQKMPDAHRRGINAKAAAKDEKRRREAKENGIILEKPTKVTKSSNSGRRDRGIGGSSIGKFSGGTLNLSKQDLQSMQSSRGRSSRGGRGGRGGRGRGRGGKRGGR